MFSLTDRLLPTVALLLLAGGCVSPAESLGVEASNIGSDFRPPVLPQDWGGADSTRWRPEATLANAASTSLNNAWAEEGVRDVVIAVPVRMWSSDLFPYGDGQSNAVPSFEGFPAKGHAPVVASLVHFKTGSSRVTLRFDRSLGSTTTIELRDMANGDAATVELTGRTDANGDVIAEWAPPSLADDARFAVHPKGWQDWFPLSFRHRVVPASSLAGPTFADGKGLLDREGISVQRNPNGAETPFERLIEHTFTASYNGTSDGRPTPYTPSDVHGRFPYFNRPIVTAVGSGFMWVADERPSGYKSLYACFTGRRAVEEASAPDGGVASGSGWHRIGDPIETIVNDLEAKPVLVAQATGNPLLASPLGFAWGLTDVATFRWLRPGEAFVTPRGSTEQPAYHSFFFEQSKNACMELLTHPSE